MKVVWSALAIDDLASIREYVSLDSPTAAKQLVSRIIALVENQLSLMPEIGRMGRVFGTRELVVPGTPYIVPYRVVEAVEIIRVYHAARRWPKTF